MENQGKALVGSNKNKRQTSSVKNGLNPSDINNCSRASERLLSKGGVVVQGLRLKVTEH